MQKPPLDPDVADTAPSATLRDFILSWQPRHGSFAAPKLNGVTADKARLLILLA
jgi:hypothetical protein